jgi:cathepsin L
LKVEREPIFDANMRAIREHNKDPHKTWFAAPNKFTAMTNEEFKSQYHGHKVNTAAMLRGASPKRKSAQAAAAEPLPLTVDWRTIAGVVTPVKNQGGCGSCWAFSATETLESHLAIATGQPAPILAPQQMVSCAPNPDKCGGTGGCQGSTQVLGYAYTAVSGISTEAQYPYKGKTGTCDPSLIKSVASSTGYVVPTPNNYTELVDALANQGPVSISLAASDLTWQIYGGGVYSAKRCGLHFCHTVVTLLLHCCHTVVIFLAHCCYTAVTLAVTQGAGSPWITPCSWWATGRRGGR